MRIVYIVNEFWFYLSMARCSLITLRKHNPSIPVDVFYIKDNNENNRNVGGLLQCAAKIPQITTNEFMELCNRLNVNVKVIDDIQMGQEKGYCYAQRKFLVNASEEKTLLLDADTFIFGDILHLFNLLDKCDFVADKNCFGERYSMTYKSTTMRPFNSGVVLWNKGLLKEYATKVFDLCLELKERTHELGDWLHQVTSDKNEPPQGREELACSIFVLDRNLKYKYFTKQDVQTNNYYGDCLIYHSLTQNWIDGYFRFKDLIEGTSSQQKKMKLSLLKPKSTFT